MTLTQKLIKSDSEHEMALSRIEELFAAEAESPEGDELELLTLLVERYEDERYPIGLPDPVAAIRFRMEQQGLGPKDLIPYLGGQSRVSEVLAGRRTLSLAMIRKLADGLRIPAEVLIQSPLPKH